MSRLGVAALIYCLVLLVVGRAVIAQDPPPAADFYVSPDGDDAWPGTLEAPFATLSRAQDAVRSLIAAGLSDDVTVLLRDGCYRVIEPVVFGLSDSAPAPHTITYAAYPGECPVISGGRPITGWTARVDGTWSVVLPQVASGEWFFRELFVEGGRRPRARHPNEGFLHVDGPDPLVGPETRTSFSFTPGDIPPETDLVGGELIFLHDWNISRVRIDHADHASNVLTLAQPIGPAPAFTVFSQLEHPRYAVENDAALLDALGEWYLDVDTGQLTYFPLPGEDMGDVEVVAPVAEALLVVRGEGESEQFVRGLRFVGIAFEHCAWMPPEDGYAEWQAGFYEWRDYAEPYDLPAAVTFELAEDCRFEECRIYHVGGWGMRLGQSCCNCAIVGSVISDVAGTGVLVGEEDSLREVGGAPWWEVRPDQAATGNVIENNLIQACGEVFHGGVGVWIGLANNTVVSHNLIRALPQVGISVGWMWSELATPCWGNKIEYNHIHDVMLMLSDGGGIYTLSRQPGTILHGNFIHDIPPNAGVHESNGIFCDEGSSDLLLNGNVIFNTARSPLRFHYGGLNIVSNNTLVVPSEDVPPVRFVADDLVDVRMIDNDIWVSVGSVDCSHPVRGAAPLAGIEPRYRAGVFASADKYAMAGECVCHTCRGDVDGSSSIDTLDISGFVAALVTDAYDACADVNADGSVNGLDIPMFVQALSGEGACPVAPTGACCVESGPCAEAEAADCAAEGGVYQGDGSVCESGLCPEPIGVCCLCEQCEHLTEAVCLDQGGTFFRLMADCEDVGPCPRLPIGACCLPNDRCEVRTECSCEELGGTYLGDATDCAAGTPFVYSASPGLPIDGGAVVTHTITVEDAFELWDVDVALELPHTWVGDLRITLEHAGRTITLMDTPLYSGCSDDFVSVVLDDEGTGGSIQDQCDLGPPGMYPTSPPGYVPAEALGAFDGLDSSGDWTIRIVDVFPLEDDGMLVSWSLLLDVLDEDLCDPPGAAR